MSYVAEARRPNRLQHFRSRIQILVAMPIEAAVDHIARYRAIEHACTQSVEIRRCNPQDAARLQHPCTFAEHYGRVCLGNVLDKFLGEDVIY